MQNLEIFGGSLQPLEARSIPEPKEWRVMLRVKLVRVKERVVADKDIDDLFS
jgi:hypothetical protein